MIRLRLAWQLRQHHNYGWSDAWRYAAELIDMRERINYILAGAYNDIGVRLWWKRKRPQLDGKTPDDIFCEEPKTVLELAETLMV